MDADGLTINWLAKVPVNKRMSKKYPARLLKTLS
jgi:hypothetical protein